MSLADLIEVLTLRNYNTQLVVFSTTLLGVASGVVGSFLLLRKRSLMGDVLAHSTLPGIALAFLAMVALGMSGKSLGGLLIGATLSGLVGVAVMAGIRRTTRLTDDAAMGLVLSIFFGLGIALLSMIQTMPGASAAGLDSLIYGKTASMVKSDFYILSITTGAAILISALLFKEFTVLCFDEKFAASQGWPVGVLDAALLILVTLVTVAGLQAVGLILVIAFLITPAAAARFWTQRAGAMAVLSGVLGGASGWLGSTVSALVPDLPAGALIVLTTTVIFLLSLFLAPQRGVFSRQHRQRQLRRKVDRQHLLRAAYEILEADSRVAATEAEKPWDGMVTNHPIARTALLAKRSWTAKMVDRILRKETRSGHLTSDSAAQSVQLSEEGFGEAARITRNHRLWEAYLVRYADIAPSHVDRDADMVEHVLDANLVRELERASQEDEAWVAVPASLHTIPTPESSQS